MTNTEQGENMSHSLVQVDSGCVRCTCGWSPTYNASENRRVHEWAQHRAQVAFPGVTLAERPVGA